MERNAMRRARRSKLTTAAIAALALASAPGSAGDRRALPNMVAFPDASGVAATFSTQGSIDLTNPFFQVLGTNGRACVTCHAPADGWSVTPRSLRARFDATGGTDPIFRTNDGSVSPNADVSTLEARLVAYDMLLGKGLLRVGIGIPANAEFELAAVDDPYGYASAKELSLFRRPLPATNLAFLSTVMFDGRETFQDPGSSDCILGTATCFASIHFDLADQANGATTGHAQATQPLTPAQAKAIVDFESSLYTAQVFDDDAGNLTARQASGGPVQLSRSPFHFGINDVVSGDYLTGVPFDPAVFRMYESWNEVGHHAPDPSESVDRSVARASVARGEALFDSKPIAIAGVGGLNDQLNAPVIQGTCSTCHDTPNAGSHSVPVPLDIGIADASRRTPDMPLYTLRHLKAPFEIVQTTDPGRALISGQWKDIGRFKGPTLRALATRAPYFHNGSAADIAAVIDFYDQRFGIGFTAEEKQDLIAFLRTL
jgi:cytochrome c peroxidase